MCICKQNEGTDHRFGLTEQGKSSNCSTIVKSRIQVFCPVPETLPKCFPSSCNRGIHSDGFPKNNQSTTTTKVKNSHLPPPWSSAQPACIGSAVQHHLPDHQKPTLPTANSHLCLSCTAKVTWETSRVSQADTTLLLLNSSTAKMLEWTQPCARCISTRSQKAAVVTPTEYHTGRRAWSPTAPQEEEGKQQVKAGNLSEQQLLKLPAS